MTIHNRPELLEALYRVALDGAAKRLALTKPEAMLILDVFNGLLLTGGILGQHARAEIQDAIRLDQVDRKWDVNGRSLVERLRELPLTLSAALDLGAADFWGSHERDDEGWERAHLGLLVRVEHGPCPKCQSTDVAAAARLPPGTFTCRACGAVWQASASRS